MPKTVCLYIDDSGTRHPDRHQKRLPSHGYDWFALGGILLNEEDESSVRGSHSAFTNKWKISYPLHSSSIRSHSNSFHWLGRDPEEKEQFLKDLYGLMNQPEILGHACVVDRSGYQQRYEGKYKNKWLLCKTAFSILVERACKFAKVHDRKVRIFVEASNKKTDRIIRSYYEEIRTQGMPFSPVTSNKYTPLSCDDFKNLLYDLKFKNKTSPLMQIADLYLWPMAIGGYDSHNKTFKKLQADRRLLVDDPSSGLWGIKYSCMEKAETPKGLSSATERATS